MSATVLSNLDMSIDETRQRLSALRVANRKQLIKSQTARQDLHCRVQILQQRTSSLIKDTGSLQPYLQAIRQVMLSGCIGSSPQYVQTLQARVCQTVHRMCVVENFFGDVQRSENESSRNQRHTANSLRDDGTKNTLDLLNKISAADHELSDYREAYFNVLKAQSKVLRFLDTQVILSQIEESDRSLSIPIQDSEQVLELKKASAGKNNIFVADLVSYHMRQFEGSGDLNPIKDAAFSSPVSVIPTKIFTTNQASEMAPPGLVLGAGP